MTTHQTHPDRVAGRNRDGFLRLALKLDAAASGAVGVLMLLAAGMVVGNERPFVNLLGTPVALLASAGLFLVAFAVFVWISGTRRRTSGTAARTVVAINALWVLASVAIVATGSFPLTALGVLFILVQAATLAELSNELGVTCERVRQLPRNAERRLRGQLVVLEWCRRDAFWQRVGNEPRNQR